MGGGASNWIKFTPGPDDSLGPCWLKKIKGKSNMIKYNFIQFMTLQNYNYSFHPHWLIDCCCLIVVSLLPFYNVTKQIHSKPELLDDILKYCPMFIMCVWRLMLIAIKDISHWAASKLNLRCTWLYINRKDCPVEYFYSLFYVDMSITVETTLMLSQCSHLNI